VSGERSDQQAGSDQQVKRSNIYIARRRKLYLQNQRALNKVKSQYKKISEKVCRSDCAELNALPEYIDVEQTLNACCRLWLLEQGERVPNSARNYYSWLHPLLN
tara:strand:+ start:394 stop:705 length:312 start_codon:yes stop_codon:yes gene_type:complete